MKTVKTCIFDKDKTLIAPEGGNFVLNPQDQIPLPGTREAVAHYAKEGYKIAIASNQGGVASGHKTLQHAIAEMRYCLKLFPEIEIAYFCPDYEGKECWRVASESEAEIGALYSRFAPYRKPAPGMLWLAIEQLGGNISSTLYVGDRKEDEEAAEAAGTYYMAADIVRERFLKPVEKGTGKYIT